MIIFSATYDSYYKLYNFDFPDWLNELEKYSIGQFIAATIEQVICIRYWQYLEQKNCKMRSLLCYSLEDSPQFYEVFEKRDKINNYLNEEILKKGRKDKVIINLNYLSFLQF